MASLSSTSVSSSSSLGNTSLRGFGGLASGIDRDAIIEQLSLATNTKISNQKTAMTKLQWKQEAYRGITDKILDLTDKYCSYSSSSNLKDPSIFSKSLVTTHGAETSTRFVKASGTSALVQNVSIAGVKKLATSTVRQSNSHISKDGLKTTLGKDFSGDMGDSFSHTSNLSGRQLTIGIWEGGAKPGEKPTLSKTVTYKFEASYKDNDGKEHKIDYTPEKGKEPDAEFYKKLTGQLKEALKYSDDEIIINETDKQKLSELMEFQYDETNNEIKLVQKPKDGGYDYTFGIAQNSSALKGVGVNADEPIKMSAGVSFSADNAVQKQSTLDYLTGKSLIFEYDGTQKNVALITSGDAAYLKNDKNFEELVDKAVKKMEEEGKTVDDETRKEILAEEKFKEMKSRLQARLDTAFGKDAIKVNYNDGEDLTFQTSNPTSSVAILSTDDNLLKNLGLEFGSSNKVNVDGKLGQAALGLNANDYTNANGQLDLKINGVSITGLTANSTISDILSKINSTKAAGVKATYVEATGQFMLVSSETGAGRQISLDSELSKALFGGSKAEASGNLVDKDGNVVATKDANGKFWLTSDPSQQVDVNGNYLDSNGKLIHKNEDGSIESVNGSGYLVNSDGKLIDNTGHLIDKNGYWINDKGQFVDANEKAINKDGHFIDDKNRLVDAKGRLVDKDGYLIDEKGNFVDEKGNKIDKEGYLVDENGNYLSAALEDGGVAVKEDEDGKWWQVDKNGNYLGTSAEGEEISMKEVDGTWYEVDENNNIVTDDDGNKVEADSTTRKAGSYAQKGVGVTDDNPVKTDDVQSSSGLEKKGGLIYKGITRLENLNENVVDGQNAKIEVSYGNGIYVDLERSSNTFNLEGLTVTVSGVFGGEYKTENGTETWVRDTSQAVTFSAEADVDAAVERVKTFMEDFNAMITEINGQVTARPDNSYGPLTDEQKEEMDETSIENWEEKAKMGILFNDDVIRDLSSSTQGILSKFMSYGVNYQDLEKIGITYSEDYTDGGTLVFDESKFRNAMQSDPDLVSDIFTGGGSVKKGLIDVVEETLNPYATRYASKNGGSYGRLVEVAGTEKKPTTLLNNQIYKQLKEMEETISKLRSQLKVEQDRYIAQFTTMENLINKMNNQSSYLSQITG